MPGAGAFSTGTFLIQGAGTCSRLMMCCLASGNKLCFRSSDQTAYDSQCLRYKTRGSSGWGIASIPQHDSGTFQYQHPPHRAGVLSHPATQRTGERQRIMRETLQGFGTEARLGVYRSQCLTNAAT